MRGERQWMHAAALALDGSSPHARGTPSRRLPGVLLGRFIPACAGNALCAEVVHRLRPVHPRMRGERTAWMHPSIDITGSSPHARGTLGENKGDPVEIRFIPACAGNAREQCRRGRLRSVHPRMRGERALTIGGAVLAAGSSPHARGTRLRRDRAALVARFIPACAGNALSVACRICSCSVHPRMRGERLCAHQCVVSAAGSSPHARGTHRPTMTINAVARFIPACAGNACVRAYGANDKTVHPRMRGERRCAVAFARAGVGSSPHARGTHPARGRVWHDHRFIPACAGNAPSVSSRMPRRAVHPRMRGERTGETSGAGAGAGSSPHARGTHFQ